MAIRGQVAKVRANREKALFSHIFNKAREWGYTSGQDPCQGFKETGRDRYITDEEFSKVKANAHFTVVDAMELALLTGQRPADVLKFKWTDIRDGALWIVQNKTNARLGIEITGELAEVITRPRKAISAFLIQDETGNLSHRERCVHASIRRARWQRLIFSFGIFVGRLQPTRATWRTHRSCWGIRTGI